MPPQTISAGILLSEFLFIFMLVFILHYLLFLSSIMTRKAVLSISYYLFSHTKLYILCRYDLESTGYISRENLEKSFKKVKVTVNDADLRNLCQLAGSTDSGVEYGIVLALAHVACNTGRAIARTRSVFCALFRVFKYPFWNLFAIVYYRAYSDPKQVLL